MKHMSGFERCMREGVVRYVETTNYHAIVPRSETAQGFGPEGTSAVWIRGDIVLKRSRPGRRAPAAAVAAGLLLAACGGGSDDGAATEATAPAEPVEADATTEERGDTPGEDATDADESVEDDQSDAPDQTGGDDGPFNVRTGSVDLQEVVEFDSGVQVAVTGITVEPMAIFVDVQVLNGWTDEYELSGWNEPRLTDNADRTYPYVVPEENQDLRVPAGGSLEATLAFRGALNPNATRVELVMNRNGSRDRDHEALFRDLPLPEGS
jgi:hypothetical protein